MILYIAYVLLLNLYFVSLVLAFDSAFVGSAWSFGLGTIYLIFKKTKDVEKRGSDD